MKNKAVGTSATRPRIVDAAMQLEESLVALDLAAKDVRHRLPGAGPAFQTVIFDDLDRRIADVRKAAQHFASGR
jgi:hypothetical protein